MYVVVTFILGVVAIYGLNIKKIAISATLILGMVKTFL